MKTDLNTSYHTRVVPGANQAIENEACAPLLVRPRRVLYYCVLPQDWESPDTMRPNAHKARLLLEESMARDPDNPWAIHLYTHLMEAGAEAGVAVAPAQKLQYLVPGAPHLQVCV